VYFVIVSLVIFYFLTNPNESSSRRPGVEEFLQAFTFGPMLMCSSSIFLLEKKLNLAAVAVAVPFYSIVVFMYFVAFLIAQSARHAAAKDRRLGGGKNCSLALYLGFEKSYRLLILFMGFFLGMYAMLAFAHHPGMLLLLVVVAKQFKAVGDHFRQEVRTVCMHIYTVSYIFIYLLYGL
jgi:hypothetical protein